MKSLKDIPPWDWPAGAGAMFLDVLRDGQAAESDRLLAAELAGDFTVINDELVDALLAVLRSGAESEKLRARAAISSRTSMRERFGKFAKPLYFPPARMFLSACC